MAAGHARPQRIGPDPCCTLCERVGEWPWSSHAATIGLRAPSFLALDRLLSHFAERRDKARERYLALVEDEEDPACPVHPLVDGDQAFVLSQLARIEPSPEYARAHVAPPQPPLNELVASASDAAAIVAAHRQHGYSMRQIATQLGCGLTTVHRRIRAAESHVDADTAGRTWKT